MSPFALPEKLNNDLARVYSYWQGLRRGGNEMPFWDDLKPAALEEQTDRFVLIDVFDQPERFRFNNLSATHGKSVGASFASRFLDEAALPHPFEYLRAQCSATIEARVPTFYRHQDGGSYARLLLPMWGDGRISMLLGAFAQP